LKIVLVGPVYPFRGGIAHYTTMLARALSAEHQVEVVSFTRQYPRWMFPGESDRDPSQQAWRVDARYMLDSLAPWTWWRTAEYILQQRPDVVLLQWWTTFWAPMLWTMGRRLRQHGLAPVFLVHNVWLHEARAWDIWLTRQVLSTGRAFLVQTEREKRRIMALLPNVEVQIFPHPVYPMLAHSRVPREAARQRLGLPTEHPLLLFFGLVRPYKGLHYLLEALGLLRQRGEIFSLLVAGEFWEKMAPYESQIRRLGLEDQVRFDNRYIPNEELSVYFSAADVFVAPYVEATGSGSVNLALGFGIQVITTFIDETLLSAGDRVTVVPPRDVTALANAVAAFRGGTAAVSEDMPAGQLPAWESANGVIAGLMKQTSHLGDGEPQ
jgi:glycosyltransferase involved in cell wall biosynthesis